MPRLNGSTKSAIRNTAARLFAERGYARTSVRLIAAEVGVDAALVIRHFGSKERLFVDAMQPDLSFREMLEGPLDDLGLRLVRYLLEADDHARGIFLALLRASDAGVVESVLKRAHEEGFVAPIRQRLTGEDVELRARLAAGAVAGLLYSLWVVGDDTVGAEPPEALAKRYGAMLQTLFTPPA